MDYVSVHISEKEVADKLAKNGGRLPQSHTDIYGDMKKFIRITFRTKWESEHPGYQKMMHITTKMNK